MWMIMGLMWTSAQASSTCTVDATGGGTYTTTTAAVAAGCTDMELICGAGTCVFPGTVDPSGLGHLRVVHYGPGRAVLDGAGAPAIRSVGVPVDLEGVDELTGFGASVVELVDAQFTWRGQPGQYAYLTGAASSTGLVAVGTAYAELTGVSITGLDVGVQLEALPHGAPELHGSGVVLSGHQSVAIRSTGCTTCGSSVANLSAALVAEGASFDASTYVVDNHAVAEAAAPLDLTLRHALLLRNAGGPGSDMVRLDDGSSLTLRNVLVMDNDDLPFVDGGSASPARLFTFGPGLSHIDASFTTIAHNTNRVVFHWAGSTTDPASSVTLTSSHVAFNDKVFSHSALSGCGTMALTDVTYHANLGPLVSWPAACSVPFTARDHQLHYVGPYPNDPSLAPYQPLPAGLEMLFLRQGNPFAPSASGLPASVFPGGPPWTVDGVGPDTGGADIGFHGTL
jgi:hypothetical protein